MVWKAVTMEGNQLEYSGLNQRPGPRDSSNAERGKRIDFRDIRSVKECSYRVNVEWEEDEVLDKLFETHTSVDECSIWRFKPGAQERDLAWR